MADAMREAKHDSPAPAFKLVRAGATVHGGATTDVDRN
jgi:hypothetical protein